MLSLERRYRLLLHAYPDAYREAHGDEIVATLLDAAEPGQIDPDVREAAWLVLAGLRTRARLAAEAGASVLWADGLRLAALLLLCVALSHATNLSPFAFVGPRAFVVMVLMAAAVAAVVAGATRVGLIALVPAAWIGLSSHLPSVPYSGWGRVTGDSAVLDELGAAGILVWYTLRGGVRRPWPGWLGLAAVAVPVVYGLGMARWGYVVDGLPQLPVSAFLVLVPVLLLSAASVVANDPRPGIAAALFCVVQMLVFALGSAYAVAGGYGRLGLTDPFYQVPLILLVLAVMAAATGMIGGRRMQSASL